MGYKATTEKNINREVERRNIRSVLDVGCGDKSYQHLFGDVEYIGIDVELSGRPDSNKNVDLFFDGENIPFEDDRFDFVLCAEVLEHCLDPVKLLSEMKRVLKADGILYLTVPSMWGEHETPYDFRRYTSFGIKKAFESAGLDVIFFEKESEGVKALISLGLSELNAHFKGKRSLRHRVARLSLKLQYVILKLLGDMPRIYLSNHIIGAKPQYDTGPSSETNPL